MLAPSLLVASVQDCPAPGTVDARVRQILGLRADEALEERATIGREGSALRVTVVGKDDRVIGDRLLQADGNCDELAGAVAVVMATWISDLHPEYVGALPDAPAPPLAPIPLAPVADAPAPRRPSPSAVRTHHFLLGAGLGANLSGGGTAPLGALGLRFVPARGGFGGALAVTLVGAREEELSSGRVRYFRWPITLGPLFRLPLASAAIDLQAGGALAWLRVEGVGFSLPVSRDAALGGAFVSTRVTWGSAQVAPFAELSGLYWQPTEAFVQRGAREPTVTLPSVEVYAALGASWQAW